MKRIFILNEDGTVMVWCAQFPSEGKEFQRFIYLDYFAIKTEFPMDSESLAVAHLLMKQPAKLLI